MNCVDLFGHRYRVLVHPGETGERFATFEMWASLNARDVPRIHHRHDVSVYVLEGSFDVWIGGTMFEVGAGADGHFLIPRGTWATFNNPDDAPARALLTVSSGAWARHVLDAGHPVTDLSAPIEKPSVPDFIRLHARDAELGIELRLPGPQAAWLKALMGAP